MKVFLAEDEPPARERLLEALARVAPQAVLLGHADSVQATAQWLAEHPAPDLLLLDIQLADGLSLELFRGQDWGVPVIFTTAHDEFAIRAFEVHAVDYLLKPVEPARLSLAIGRLRERIAARSSVVASMALAPRQLLLLTTDGSGRLAGIRRPGSATNNTTVTYTGSRVTQVVNDGETRTYTWGTSGTNTPLTTTTGGGETEQRISDPATQAVLSTSDGCTGPTCATTYTTDFLGRVTRETRPEGDYTNYTLDMYGNATEIREVAKPELLGPPN